MISYSPAIYYRRLKYLIETEGFRFDEVVVFLDISDIQDEVSGVFLDEDDNVIGRGGGTADRWLDSVIEPIRSFMKDSSLLYRFISEANRARKRLWTHANECLERLGTRADDPRPLGLEFLRQQLVNPRNSWTFDEAVYQEWGREGLEIASANMDRLRAVLGTSRVSP